MRSDIALGLLSAALIAYQLVLMQVLSITQWHHFAHMILSIALLGFGAAGTFLALFRTFLMPRYERLFPVLMFLSGAAMAWAVGLSQHDAVRFDSFLLFTGAEYAVRLCATYITYCLPFFLGALAIGLAFTCHSRRIGVLYFWNLAGSGAGGLLALGLMWHATPAEAPVLLALAAFMAGLMALSAKAGKAALLAAVISLVGIGAAFFYPPSLIPSEFKGISRAMQLPGVKLEREKVSPYGFLQVFSSPALRHAPGLSLTYPDTVPVQKAVFQNGDWVGPLYDSSASDDPVLLDYSTHALAYALAPRRSVLVLGMSTGQDVVHAIRRQAERITAVELNPALLALLAEESGQDKSGFLNHHTLTIHKSNPRSWLLQDPTAYDLIILPTIDSFGGTSGLNALQEQYLFTQEAFRAVWRQLTSRGVLSVTCWMDYPPRHTLRLLATIVEMLAQEGIDDPRRFVAAVRSWGTVTYIVQKTPLTSEDIGRIRSFAKRLNFDPVLLPGITPSERVFYNALQDELFFAILDRILDSDREPLYRSYAFNLRPATDDRPYFAQFLRLSSLPDLAAHFGGQNVTFIEIGYLLVFMTLFQAVPAALFLIALPLVAGRGIGRGGGRWATFIYFSGIGAGYLFVEMALIQRFVLYLGNPIHAAAVVVSVMLFASGLGSYASSRWPALKLKRLPVMGGIILLLLCGGALLTPFMLITMGFSPAGKFLVTLLILFPPAFLMGIPFPAGITNLSQRSEADIPWAWGINGCFSVLGAPAAAVIAVEFGFTALMLCASLAYAGTWAAAAFLSLYGRSGIKQTQAGQFGQGL